MSKTIDERVVSMQFDNKQFESNVATTMSTLDKLKQKLNLSGASKGLQDINTAASKFNISPLGTAVDSVRTKFSALEVMGVTALANITNSAVNAGKRIMSALTIDPVKTGLSEYETKINAVQVIKANTRTHFSSEEEQMEAINKALADLNDYADRTIYNFAQMTDNVGKFVAQGLEVEEATKAVQGLANLAGASGASAQDMARATYQMSQALGGTIRKIDWNSLRNANMATVELKNTLMDIARVRGIDIDSMIAEKGTFEDTLEKGWLSGELFTEAMNIYSDVYSEAELRAKGFNDAQIENFKNLAKTASEATTEVKTLNQLWDVLKETAQSGWTQSWEILFGDFNTAKKSFTEMQVYFSDILNRWSEVRNTILGGVFNIKLPWQSITEKLEASGLGKIADIGEKIADVTHKLEDFQDIVSKVWHGDFGNVDTGRFEKLEKLGWDPRVVQDLVNKGNEYKLTVEDVEASHKKFGLTLDKSSDSVKKMIDPLAGLTDEQLRNAGLTETEINLFRDLEKEAKRTGVTISELVDKMSKNDGRTLLIESFKNAWSGLVKIIESVKAAWHNIFPPVSVVRIYSVIEAINKFSEKLIMAPHTAGLLTRTLEGLFAALDLVGTVLGGPIKIGFKILQQFLAAFDLDILSLTAKIGDAIVKFNDWVNASLDFSAVFEKIAPKIKIAIDWIKKFIGSIKDGLPSLDSIKSSLADVVSSIQDFWSKIWGVLTGKAGSMNDSGEGIGSNLVLGIINGIWEGIKSVVSAIKTFCTTIIDTVKSIFGIHSPSVVFMTIGGFLVAGLVLGIVNSIPSVGEALAKLGSYLSENFSNIVSGIGDKIKNLFAGFDFTKISAVFWTISSFLPNLGFLNIFAAIANAFSAFGATVSDGAKTVADKTKSFGTKVADGFRKAFEIIKKAVTAVTDFLSEHFASIAAIIGGVATAIGAIKLANVVTNLVNTLGAIPEGLKNMFESFGKAREIEAKSKLVLNWGIAIGVLAAALYFVSKLSWAEIGRGAAVIGGLAIVLSGLTLALNKLTSPKGATPEMLSASAKNMRALGTVMLSIAASVAILALALKLVDTVNPDNIWRNLAVIGIMTVGVAGLAILMSKMAPKMTKGSLSIIAVALAVHLMVSALRKLNDLTIDEPGKLVTSLLILIGGLALIGLACKSISGKAAFGLLGMALSLLVIMAVIKKLGDVDTRNITKNMNALFGIMLIFMGLMVATNVAGENAQAAGKAMLSISAALVLTAFAIKILGDMNGETLKNGTKAISQILIMFGLLIGLTHFAGQHAAKAGAMLTSAAVAILILSGAIAILANIDNTEGLKRATIVVSILLGLFGGLIFLSKYAQKATGSLVAIAITIGILVAAIGILSMLDAKDLAVATAVVTVLMGVLAGVIACLKFVQGGKASIGVIGTLLVLVGCIAVFGHLIRILANIPNPNNALAVAGALSAVMLALATAVRILSNANAVDITALATAAVMIIFVAILGSIIEELQGLDPNKSMKITASLSGLLVAISGACLILSKCGDIAGDAVFAAMAMGIVLAEIAVVLSIAQDLGVDAAYDNVIALGALLVVISGACLILSKCGNITSDAIFAAMAMGIVLAEIAVVLGIVQYLGVDAAYDNVISLGALLLVISGACVILSKCGDIAGDAVFAAMAMGIVLAEIAVVLSIAQDLGVDAAYNNVIALGALLLVISGACLILSKCGNITSDAIFVAMAMGIVLAEIAVVLGICQSLGVDAAMNNVLALSTLLIAISMACVILDGVKSVSLNALLAVAALGVILIELGVVLSIINHMQIESCMGTVLSLSTLLIALSLVTVILSAIGPNALNAIPAAIGLMGVIAVIGGVALAIGGLMSLISPETIATWSTGLQLFMDFIVILAQGIGEAVGALIGGTLAGVGQGLSDFMTNLQGFIEGAKNIDVSMAEGMKALGAAILAITAASILDGLSKLLGLGSMESLGTSMASFGGSMIAFADSISTLTEEDITRIKMAAEAGTAMADMEGKVPKQGGWWQEIAGSSDMSDFGTRMVAFGASLLAFSASISTLTEEDANRITMAATAGNAMADMEGKVPKQGGWWQEIAGASDMADFGSRMVAFGASLLAFSASISTLTEEDTNRITTAATVSTAMAEMEGKVPKQGGWWQDIAGSSDIADFGSRMVAFGVALVDFSNSVADLSDTAAADITNAIPAIEAMVAAADLVPKTDKGLWGDIAGETDVGAFGEGMVSLAKGLKKYADASAEIDQDAIDNITNSKDAIEAMREVAGVITGEGVFNLPVDHIDKIGSFGTGMKSLGTSLKAYSSTVSEGIDVDAITNSKTAIIAMADAAKALPNEGGVAGFFAGENSDISGFGTKMVGLADQVMAYATKVSEITTEDIVAIGLSKTAILAMADAAKALPNEGGVAGFFAGENSDISGFGTKMVGLADQVMVYATKVSEITPEDILAINLSRLAIIAMTDAAKALPNEGGVAGFFAGENSDISGFGTKMVALALSLNTYIASVSGITEASVSQIVLSGNCVAALVGVGVRASLLTNVNISDVSTVSDNLLSVATLVYQYAAKIIGITDSTIAKIVLSGNAILALAGVASKASLLNNFGTGVSDAAIAQLGKLVDLARGMAGVDFSPMGAFAQNLSAIGEAGVSQFIAAFTGSYDRVSTAGLNMINMLCQGVQSGSSNVIIAVTLVTGYMVDILSGNITVFYNCGIALMTQFATGIVAGGTSATAAVSTVLVSVVGALSGTYTGGYSAGGNLVDGFAAGITVNTFKARASAIAMATAALEAAKSVLKINSPSKVFRDVVGMAVPEGVAAGIEKFTYMVTDSTSTMGETALQGAKKAIAKLADYVDTDIDTQPTIRPVLDLSEISSGADAISGLFNMTPSVGVLANVGSISSMMNNQNGANADIVSAIDKLRKGLDNVGNTSYHIDGITYDDGSNIAEAMKVITRAAIMGRRV